MNNENNGSGFQIELDELITYLGELTAAFEEHPDEQTRLAVVNLLQGLDALHREAFTRLTAYLNEHQAGHLMVEAAEADRLISTVLTLYDLLPAEVSIRQAEAALAPVRPYIESHGGELKVLDVAEGVVYVHMGGACQGCAGATYTLRRGIRQALEEGFPGFEKVVVTEPGPPDNQPTGFIGLDQIYTPPSLLQGPAFQTVTSVDELPPHSMRQVKLDDVQLLIVNTGSEIYAVGAMCPGSMLPLSNGHIDGETLICGWHNERYDLRTGACLERGGTRQTESLPVYPVAVQDGHIQAAVNVPARPPVAVTPHEQ